MRKRLGALALGATLALAFANPAHALRVVTWNLTMYDNPNITARQGAFRTVMQGLDPDLLMVEEITSPAAVDSFLDNVLNVIEPGQWAATGNTIDGFQNQSVYFYKTAKMTLTNVTVLSNPFGPRTFLLALVNPAGYGDITAKFQVYTVHFKAGGPFTPDSTTRRNEATGLRNNLNLLPANTNFLVGGDMNLYGAYEGAYIRLTESQTNNNGRNDDVLNIPGNWHAQPAYALFDTQCPCKTGCATYFAGGGLDDRFDLILSSYSMQDGQGVDLLPGGYSSYGNDGQHFNNDVNGGGFNNAVGLTIANALHAASDHLPVLFVVQLAPKVVAASSVSFGDAIVGGAAQQTLNVANGATPPANVLHYSFAAPAGFGAPAGSFQATAGAAPNPHALTMSTASSGLESGTLVMTTDDRDSLSKNVLLSGRVLDHAVASLDSGGVVTSGDTLDFGMHGTGGFSDLDARAFNLALSTFQARLAVNAAVVNGGDGRFSFTGGFQPGTIDAGAGRSWTLHFDDSGATADSTYEATLVFSTADEPLPGGQPQPDLTVMLRARLTGTTGVAPGTPTVLRFEPPRPNPAGDEARFAFDLPRAAPVSLELFDLSGRRVARIASGALEAGHHETRWRPLDDRGARIPAGLYFVRFSTPGLTRVSRLALLP